MSEPTKKDAAYFDAIREKVKAENKLIQTAKQRLANEAKLQTESHTTKLLRRNKNENPIN